MTDPRYVKIYCETQRERDMAEAESYNRWQLSQKAGKCYAEYVAGRWQCCCCGTPVAVVW